MAAGNEDSYGLEAPRSALLSPAEDTSHDSQAGLGFGKGKLSSRGTLSCFVLLLTLSFRFIKHNMPWTMWPFFLWHSPHSLAPEAASQRTNEPERAAYLNHYPEIMGVVSLAAVRVTLIPLLLGKLVLIYSGNESSCSLMTVMAF